MRKTIHWLLMIAIVLFGVTACEDDPEEQETPEAALALYVLNAIGVTISQVDLETDAVTNNVGTLGQYPNQVMYHKGKVYVVNSGTNNIMIFDPDNNFAAETPIALGDGNNPMNMVFYDDNTAYVACSMSGKVLKVNMATKTVAMEITAGTGTTGITLADGKIYATNSGFNPDYTYSPGTVTVINGATGAVVTTIDVELNPQAAATDPDGLVHVVCTGDWWSTFGKVVVINPATDTVVETIMTAGTPGSIAISESDGIAYLGVWGYGLLSYNWETYAMVSDTSDYFWGSGGSGVTCDTEGHVFLSIWDDDQVLKLGADETVLATYDVGDSPSSLALRIE
ncbi:MAG: YncE family protein [Candidatus Marinimicrobia bacterium]|nr:YncE family protein [FCB group bacterium]MBL7025109.1 YncE family protein [Candidatus Neomarinimicrobiota bacterium]